ncbi:MAG: hypothetical protein EXR71_14880 [Myxococcales bacterium]|nr:hypothetical protein [Myxococcales bacterium]
MNLVDGAPGAVPADDPGLLSGLAVFEALRTYARRPFRLGAHLARLRASAAWFGIPVPVDGVFAHEIEELIAASPGELVIVVILTDGGRRVVRTTPVDPSRAGCPVRLATIPFDAPPWLPGWVKHTNRAAWLLAARQRGVDEVLLVGADGNWTEANRSNLVAVRDGVVHTPPADGRILDGVTRRVLLECAAADGIRVVETPLAPGSWDELYVCSTLKELAPVVELDGRAAAGGGPVGGRLHALFCHATNRPEAEG